MIAVFVRQKDAIELIGHHAALFEAKCDLSRGQPAIDQNFAMVGGNKRAVPGATASEHGQTEHESYLATACQFSQINFSWREEFSPPGNARIYFFFAA